jgi:hypothetical protein
VVESLGLRISTSEISRICQGLDERLEASATGHSRVAIRTCGMSRMPLDFQRLAHSGDSAADAPPTELPGSGPCLSPERANLCNQLSALLPANRYQEAEPERTRDENVAKALVTAV